MKPAGALKRTDNDAQPPLKVGKRFATILDAAEFVFADKGFNGASMREIATRAGVAQALIHYHFDNKEKLFEAMAARQANTINGARAELLSAILTASETPVLEDVVEALFRPTIETGKKLSKQGGGYSRILVSVANSSDVRDTQLTERYYDPIAQKFIEAFSQIEPGLQHKDAVWAYMFSIGVGMTMMAQTGRSKRLSDGACDDGNIEEMLSEIVIYVCGGIRALVAQKGAAEKE